MMPKHGVEWSLLGYTVVEAVSAEAADEIVQNMSNKTLEPDIQDLEISDVVLEGEKNS